MGRLLIRVSWALLILGMPLPSWLLMFIFFFIYPPPPHPCPQTLSVWHGCCFFPSEIHGKFFSRIFCDGSLILHSHAYFLCKYVRFLRLSPVSGRWELVRWAEEEINPWPCWRLKLSPQLLFSQNWMAWIACDWHAVINHILSFSSFKRTQLAEKGVSFCSRVLLFRLSLKLSSISCIQPELFHYYKYWKMDTCQIMNII